MSDSAPKMIETLRQVFQALSGHVTDAKPRWLDLIHRRDAADLAANSRLSEIVTQTKPRNCDEQTNYIDSLFGSEAWLTGRHYQKS